MRTIAARFTAILATIGLTSAATLPALAGGLISEIRIGALAHDVDHLWSGFRLEPASLDLNLEVLFAPHLTFLGGTLRPAAGMTVNTAGATSKAYIDARWEFGGALGPFLGLGIGAAVHDGNIGPTAPDMKALGSRVLFHVPIELGWRLDRHNSVSIYFEHISNGYTQRYNEGLDSLGLRYGYRF